MNTYGLNAERARRGDDLAAEIEYESWAAEQYREWHAFTPELTRAYWSYVSQGYADTDGFYAPLRPGAWLATIAR